MAYERIEEFTSREPLVASGTKSSAHLRGRSSITSQLESDSFLPGLTFLGECLPLPRIGDRATDADGESKLWYDNPCGSGA